MIRSVTAGQNQLGDTGDTGDTFCTSIFAAPVLLSRFVIIQAFPLVRAVRIS